MPRRLPGLLLTLLAGAPLLVACREARPWDAPDWRPAQPPQRIVAASLLATEVLLAIAPRERIAGVHYLAADARFSLVVDAVKGLPLLGAEPEQLLAAKPDLVVCDAFTRPETLALLGRADVPVVRTAAPSSFADIAVNVRRVGSLCHCEEGAERVVRTMQERLQALAARAVDLGAWRVLELDGGLHTHGRGSLFDAVVQAAGATNLATQRGVGPFRKLDLEAVLAWRPDALVLGDAVAGGGDDGVVPAWLQQQPGLPLLACIEKRRVVHLPFALLGTTSHHLVDAVERLQDALRTWGRP